jgi:glutamate carboxypeptidase
MSKHELYQEMRRYLEQNQAKHLLLLQQMVAINSFTENPSGINALGALTAKIFAPLGFTADSVQSLNDSFGKHLVLTKNGRSDRKIGFVSHLDTVFPPDEEIRNDFLWRIEGDQIFGPGTVDIKGGTLVIYMMMAALKTFLPDVYNDITWVILLDASEETDGEDFGDLCIKHLAGNTLACLIFEGGSMQGNEFKVVVARKGMAIYHASVEGKASHAGSAHEFGANAIVQLADLIQQISALTNYEQNITFNVGTIHGGTVTNRVPHHASAKIEMRAFSKNIYEQGISNALALADQVFVHSAQDGYPCRTTIEVTRKTKPWQRNQQTDDLFAIWQAAGEALGYKVIEEERGGLSDGNYFWDVIPCIDGLGPSGGNAHCSERSENGAKEQEYVSISSFIPKTLLNIAGVLRLVGYEA